MLADQWTFVSTLSVSTDLTKESDSSIKSCKLLHEERFSALSSKKATAYLKCFLAISALTTTHLVISFRGKSVRLWWNSLYFLSVKVKHTVWSDFTNHTKFMKENNILLTVKMSSILRIQYTRRNIDYIFGARGKVPGPPEKITQYCELLIY